jgi:hypothetical protein
MWICYTKCEPTSEERMVSKNKCLANMELLSNERMRRFKEEQLRKFKMEQPLVTCLSLLKEQAGHKY